MNFHKEMLSIYGGKCLSRKAVHSWVEKCSQCRLKVAEDVRTSHPIEIVTEAILKRVKSRFELTGGQR
jgi:hypothetical protein